MKLTLDLHGIYNSGAEIEKALKQIFDEAVAKKAPLIEIIPGKGSGQLKKHVLRFLQRKDPPPLSITGSKRTRRTSAASSSTCAGDHLERISRNCRCVTILLVLSTYNRQPSSSHGNHVISGYTRSPVTRNRLLDS